MAGSYATTARYALRKLLGSSLISDIDEGFASLADDIDAVMVGFTSGAIADLPASTPGDPGIAGREYYATDTGQLLKDTGTGWMEPGTMVGDLKATTRSTAPFGWALFNGQALSRTSYPALWAHAQAEIAAGSTLFTNGNGSTTFGLADLRGRAPVMAGQGSGLTNRALGAAFGEETHQLTEAELAVHDHPDNIAYSAAGSHAHSGSSGPSSPLTHDHPGSFVVCSDGLMGTLSAKLASSGDASFYVPGSAIASSFGRATATGSNTTLAHSHSIATDGNHTHDKSGGVQNAGSGTAHPNVQPSLAVQWMVKT
jgi:microcystin-dependent protein